MVKLVIDASLTLAWCFADERNHSSQALLNDVARNGARAPAIWWFEVTNALLIGEIRKRISREDVDDHVKNLAELPVAIDSAQNVETITRIMELARTQRLTTYDASYNELALRYALPIATRDTAMQNAARKLGLEIIPA